jgi:hypothetical protein
VRQVRCQPIFDAPGVVPKPDRWFRLIVFVPKYAQACGIKHEQSSGARIEPYPACRQNSEKMSARKQQNVARNVANPLHDPIGPNADLIRCFSSGTTIAKQLPARSATS